MATGWKRRTGVAAALLIGSALATSSGCSVRANFEITKPAVAKKDLQGQIKGALEKKTGTPIDGVQCPDDLEGEVGNTTKCVLTTGGDRYGVSVRVTSVRGTKVNFYSQVDKNPMT